MSLNEVIGDIWSFLPTHRIVIPTNQLGVMGAGLALEAKQHYPGIQAAYQQALKTIYDKANPWMSIHYPNLILAPTKRHWKDKSNIDDLAILLEALSKIEGGLFAIPEMGCGLGGLTWNKTSYLYNVFIPTKDVWTVVHPQRNQVKLYTGILRQC